METKERFLRTLSIGTRRDRLFIGEFLRRHHHRLAHEIALYGFPGASTNVNGLPVLTELLHKLADLAGVVARSHGMSLRVCLDYVRYRHPSVLRPSGTVPIYHMALLRVADYLQMDADRAPPVLLQLRAPQSPVSIEEWKKHSAVDYISFDNSDPEAIYVHLNSTHELETHLQIQKLLDGLQVELDFSAAVLSETYGRDRGLSRLRLNRSRVRSNIDEPSLLEDLPYLPVQSQLGADPRILGLLAGPLYGHHPEIGIRELLQNAVDAVRERRWDLIRHGESTDPRCAGRNDCDVLISITTGKGAKLNIVDNGTGMSLDVIRKYFLRAGASLRESQAWKKSFENEEGMAHVLRAGRFGIGVLSAFLLGSHLRVKTRHIKQRGRMEGVVFSVSRSTASIGFSREDLPVGTQIEIPLSQETANRLAANPWLWDWYSLCDVRIKYSIDGREIEPRFRSPTPDTILPPPVWHEISLNRRVSILWTYEEHPYLTYNGLVVGENARLDGVLHGIDWSRTNKPKELGVPKVSVFDPDCELEINLQRTEFQQPAALITGVYDDLCRDFVAFALVSAPKAHISVDSSGYHGVSYPLWTYESRSFSRWFCTPSGAGLVTPQLVKESGFDTMLSCARMTLRAVRPEMYYVSLSSWWPSISSSAWAACVEFDSRLRLPARKKVTWYLRDLILSMLGQYYPKKVYEQWYQAVVCFDPSLVFNTERPYWLEDVALQKSPREAEEAAVVVTLGELDSALDLHLLADQGIADALSALLVVEFQAIYPAVRSSERERICDVWLRYLGQPVIPFDADERAELIAKTRALPGMTSKLEFWQRRKGVFP